MADVIKEHGAIDYSGPYIEWTEPLWDNNGKIVPETTVYCRMMPEQAIKETRQHLKALNIFDANLSDDDILEDFITIHWAKLVHPEKKNAG